MTTKKLEWEDKYSVGVLELDNQHKKMFATINELIQLLGSTPTQESLSKIINELVNYKMFHFATEENYFKIFEYEDADTHIREHLAFSEKLANLQAEFKTDTVSFAYKLIDFLEDWLINHLMSTDHKYIECFKSHGLK